MKIISVNLSTRLVNCGAALMFFVLVPSVVLGLPTSSFGTSVSIDDLKGKYIECERAAMVGGLGVGGIMLCTSVYEDLKRRAFDGEFKKLKAWWDANKQHFGIEN